MKLNFDFEDLVYLSAITLIILFLAAKYINV